MEVAEAAKVNEDAEVSKVWKTPNEVFKIIQVLRFNNLGIIITLF